MREKENKNFGKEFFDSAKDESGVFKSYYFEDWYPSFYFLATSIKKHVNPQRVLDIGCAKGFLVKAFKNIGIEAWGVDISKYALSNAPRDIQRRLYQVDLNKGVLPFKKNYFDLITFLGTIEYLDDHKNIIIEINRVLKDKGGLYLTTIYKKDPRDDIRINIHSRSYWINEFRSYGFKIVKEKCDALFKDRLMQTFTTTHSNSIKFNLGKLLHNKGGHIGKEIVFLYSNFLGTYGSLFFIKER